MRTSILFMLPLLLACTPPNTAPRPSEFPKLNDALSLPSDSSRYLIDHNRFVFGNTCRMGNIDWTIGVNNSSEIIYFETSDIKFMTPEGLSMSSTLSDVIKKGGTNPTIEFNSVYKSRLPSGWYAVFVFGLGVPNETIPNAEHPSWFCKQLDSSN